MANDSIRRWRFPWRMRFAAIALGFLPLLCCELLLRAFDLPRSSPIDPYLDLHHLKPLFTLDATTGSFKIGSDRQRLFRPAEFPAEKTPKTVRIFALGGSTTQGEPYSTETAFPQWLQLNLEARFPDTHFEVINCGGLSYASYRVLAILREVLEYDPDLIVVYTGHNEFLERRSYEADQSPSMGRTLIAYLSQLRTVRLVNQAIVMEPDQSGDQSDTDESTREQKSKSVIAAEVDALLDYAGGLEDYHRDDPWREPVVEHFRWNLEQMITCCREREVPLVLCRPVSNLRDCPPFKFEAEQSLDEAQLAEFNAAWELARDSDQPNAALAAVERALAIDPQHAGALYLRGRLLFEAGEWIAAREQFTLARDADVCPLRAITPIADAVSELAAENETPLLDVEALLTNRSPHGIPGNEWLLDHVHPTVEGHQLIGESLAELCLDAGIVKPATNESASTTATDIPSMDWHERRQELYRLHFLSLGEDYFHRGKQRLEGLMLWTQGRAKKIKPE